MNEEQKQAELLQLAKEIHYLDSPMIAWEKRPPFIHEYYLKHAQFVMNKILNKSSN